MREIKFRVWTGLKMEHDIMAGFLGAFYVAGLDPKDSASMSQANTIYHKDNPVMQFTGLKDKNGKEIYDGDVLKDKNGRIGKVYFDEAQWFGCGDYLHYASYHSKIEIIGNIYENPELVKQ